MLKTLATTCTMFLLVLPEGSSLFVMLYVTYSTKQMIVREATIQVRKMWSWVTAGYASAIIVDEASLSSSQSSDLVVTDLWLGDEGEVEKTSDLPKILIELLHQGIGLNISPLKYFRWKPTRAEKALLPWAATNLGMNTEELQRSCVIVCVNDSDRDRSMVCIRKTSTEEQGITHIHWKGSAKKILPMCTGYYGRDGRVYPMEIKRRKLQNMAKVLGRYCLAFAHKRVTTEVELGEDLTLLGLVGMDYPCPVAVKECRDAGINIVVVCTNNIKEARRLVGICGVDRFSQDLNMSVITTENFQSYSSEERAKMVGKIRLLASSSPSDKILLIQCLKQKGEIVAVTGSGFQDVLALKEADVRISLGIPGVKVVEDIADILIHHPTIDFIVSVKRMGRSIFENIQKFIQLQLTVLVAVLATNFIATVLLGEESTFTTLEVLWVDLIISCMWGSDAVDQLSYWNKRWTQNHGQTGVLITNIMLRNTMAQALFQSVIVLILRFKGEAIYGVDESTNKSLVYNTFVLCQAFNVFNTRELKNKNIFKGLRGKSFLWGSVGIASVLHVLVMELLRTYLFSTAKLNWFQWCVCIGMAMVSWPVGLITKTIPVPNTSWTPKFLAFNRASLSR